MLSGAGLLKMTIARWTHVTRSKAYNKTVCSVGDHSGPTISHSHILAHLGMWAGWYGEPRVTGKRLSWESSHQTSLLTLDSNWTGSIPSFRPKKPVVELQQDSRPLSTVLARQTPEFNSHWVTTSPPLFACPERDCWMPNPALSDMAAEPVRLNVFLQAEARKSSP